MVLPSPRPGLATATTRVPRSRCDVSMASRTARYCSAAKLVGASKLTR
jgi:hypothetical protein